MSRDIIYEENYVVPSIDLVPQFIRIYPDFYFETSARYHQPIEIFYMWQLKYRGNKVGAYIEALW